MLILVGGMSRKREIRDYLEDILESVDDIRSFTNGTGFDDFVADKKTINAVIRSLEIIGEAAKKIPADIRAQKKKDVILHSWMMSPML